MSEDIRGVSSRICSRIVCTVIKVVVQIVITRNVFKIVVTRNVFKIIIFARVLRGLIEVIVGILRVFLRIWFATFLVLVLLVFWFTRAGHRVVVEIVFAVGHSVHGTVWQSVTDATERVPALSIGALLRLAHVVVADLAASAVCVEFVTFGTLDFLELDLPIVFGFDARAGSLIED